MGFEFDDRGGPMNLVVLFSALFFIFVAIAFILWLAIKLVCDGNRDRYETFWEIGGASFFVSILLAWISFGVAVVSALSLIF